MYEEIIVENRFLWFIKWFFWWDFPCVVRLSRHTWRSWITKYYTTKTKGWGYEDFFREHTEYIKEALVMRNLYPKHKLCVWSITMFQNRGSGFSSQKLFLLLPEGLKLYSWMNLLWTLAEHSTGQIHLGACEAGLHFRHPMVLSRSVRSSLSLLY